MRKLIITPQAWNQFLKDWNAYDYIQQHMADEPGDDVEVFESGHVSQGSATLDVDSNAFNYEWFKGEIEKYDSDYLEESGY